MKYIEMQDWGKWTLVGWEDGNGWGERTINAGSKKRRRRNKGGVLFYVFRHENPTTAKRKKPLPQVRRYG